MPGEPLDAPDDLRKQALSQLGFDQLQDEVPGMSDEASAGLGTQKRRGGYAVR